MAVRSSCNQPGGGWNEVKEMLVYALVEHVFFFVFGTERGYLVMYLGLVRMII